MNEDSYDARNRHLRNLVIMAMADGQLGEREIGLVHDRCTELGLGEDELQQAIHAGLDDDAAMQLPTDPHQRQVLMTDLIRVMAVDGRIQEGEKRLLALAAARMKIAPPELAAMFAAVIKSGGQDPPDS